MPHLLLVCSSCSEIGTNARRGGWLAGFYASDCETKPSKQANQVQKLAYGVGTGENLNAKKPKPSGLIVVYFFLFDGWFL